MSIKIYWYPRAADGSESATINRLTFPSSVGLESRIDVPLRDGDDVEAPAGYIARATYGGQLQVSLSTRIPADTTANQDFLRDLRSISSHLEIGGHIFVALDHTKAGAWPVLDTVGPTYVVPTQGDSAADLGEEVCEVTVATPTLAVDDDMVIETETPEYHRHWARVTARTLTSGDLTAVEWANDFLHNSSAERAWVRHKDFYPWLFLPEEGLNRSPIAWNPQENVWTWDVTLHMRPDFIGEAFKDLN